MELLEKPAALLPTGGSAELRRTLSGGGLPRVRSARLAVDFDALDPRP